jgi:hypothetical protein
MPSHFRIGSVHQIETSLSHVLLVYSYYRILSNNNDGSQSFQKINVNFSELFSGQVTMWLSFINLLTRQ